MIPQALRRGQATLKGAVSPGTPPGLNTSQGLTNNPNSGKASCSRFKRSPKDVKHAGGTVCNIQTVLRGDWRPSNTLKCKQDPNLSGCGMVNNGSPKYARVLILGTYMYVILCDKRDFVGMIKFKILRWGDNSDYPGGFHKQSLKRVLARGRQEGQSQREATMEAVVWSDGRRGHKPRTSWVTSRSWKL